MNNVYQQLVEFKRKYPMSVAWRLGAHAKVIERHLNPEEEVKYAFVAQKGNNSYDIFSTNAIVITNKRIMIGTKRILFGYFFTSITPDMFNDLKVQSYIIWGRVFIDTIKEFISLSNIDKNALNEIETNITEYVMKEKQKYKERETESKKENI